VDGFSTVLDLFHLNWKQSTQKVCNCWGFQCRPVLKSALFVNLLFHGLICKELQSHYDEGTINKYPSVSKNSARCLFGWTILMVVVSGAGVLVVWRVHCWRISIEAGACLQLPVVSFALHKHVLDVHKLTFWSSIALEKWFQLRWSSAYFRTPPRVSNGDGSGYRIL
jgi:hypothetical protein